MITFERAVFASILLHAFIIAAFSLAFRQNQYIPLSYEVNLVTGPGSTPSAPPKAIAAPKQPEPAVQPETPKPAPKEMSLPQPKPAPTPKVKAPDHAGYKQPDKSDQQDQEALNDWMALHEGLARAKHRVKIRTEIKVGSNNNNPQAGSQNDSSAGLYASRLKGCIAKYVVYPDIGEDNKVTVDITILNDGELPFKIVSSSGNSKFDSAVAAAINRAGECAGPPPANYYKTILEATIHQ